MRHATVFLILLLGRPQDPAADLKLCFDEAMNAASVIKDDYHQSDLMKEIAEVQARAGLAKEALETVQSMTYDYFQSLAYADVGLALGKSGRLKEARDILEKGLVSTAEGEQDFRTPDSFGRIAKAFAELGDVDRALKIAAGVKKGVFDEDTMQQIGMRIAKAGDLEKGLKIAGPFKDGYEKWWFHALVTSHVKAGGLKAAEEVARRMTDVSMKSSAHLEISKAYAAKAQWDDALRVADSIGDADDRIEALVEIGVLLAKAGKALDESRMRMAEDLLKDVKNHSYRVEARLQIARWKAAAGDREGGLAMALAAREDADKIEEWADWSRVSIASSIAELGDHDRAVALALTLSDDSKSSALMCIAEAHARAGNWKKFKEALEGVTHPRQLAQAHYEAGQAEWQRGASAEARRLFRESFKHLDGINVGFREMNDHRNGTVEFTLLLSLLEAQAKAGDFEGALTTALKGEKEQNGEVAGSVVRKLARLEAKEGRFTFSLLWIRKLKEPFSRGLAYVGAAEGLIER